MEPFRQKGSSMASWSTFIFKSACCENLADVLLVQLCKIMKCQPTDYKNEITIFGCRTLVWRKSLLPRLWNWSLSLTRHSILERVPSVAAGRVLPLSVSLSPVHTSRYTQLQSHMIPFIFSGELATSGDTSDSDRWRQNVGVSSDKS